MKQLIKVFIVFDKLDGHPWEYYDCYPTDKTALKRADDIEKHRAAKWKATVVPIEIELER